MKQKLNAKDFILIGVLTARSRQELCANLYAGSG